LADVWRYRSGGTGTNVVSAHAGFSFRWQHLNVTEYNDLVAVLNQIRSGASVSITALDGLDYVHGDIPDDGLAVDLDSDEVPESQGEFVEFMPMELDMVSLEPVYVSTDDHEVDMWYWGDTDINFEDDLSDKPFDYWPE